MKRFLILIVVLALLLLSCIPFFIEGATSVVPGWHVTIFPPQFILSVIIIIVLLIMLAYLLLARSIMKPNWLLFGVHFLLTLPVLFARFPTFFIPMTYDPEDPGKSYERYLLLMRLIPFAYLSFIIGQAIFGIYLYRVLKRKRSLAV